ncbi:hypothetical protein C8N35_102138 [Breoghania corrubedonensis]|uniref:Uncharacterized protein n=1 Tax=Breoghania corrubedonensis TaxID=665038 RepID=A0A2T5VCD9_9HYPH|nr:hypothetical protein [Breoghania corrubedonensis]PTW61429.1 hypothetical protein C8N35_102138 [Breoghania corrubedonensis]
MPVRSGGRYYADKGTGKRTRAPKAEQIEQPAEKADDTEAKAGADAPKAETRRGRKPAPNMEG